MRRLDFRKLLFLQYAVFAVVVGTMGALAFGLMLWDFQIPGTFKSWYLFQGGMPLNLVLLICFGLQHSLMARRGFKQALARYMPVELERSFYVMVSGFVLFALSLLWSPSDPPLYDVRGTWLGHALHGMAALGLPVMALALVAHDPLDLIGLRAVALIWQGRRPAPLPLRTPHVYRVVRHPLYLGMLLLFWFSPAMTHDHLFFAEVMTAYLLIGIQFEEADLLRQHGEAYRRYQAEVPMLLPLPWRRTKKHT